MLSCGSDIQSLKLIEKNAAKKRRFSLQQVLYSVASLLWGKFSCFSKNIIFFLCKTVPRMIFEKKSFMSNKGTGPPFSECVLAWAKSH